MRSAALALRVWFRHCETRGWVRPGLAAAVLVPRIYSEERIPIGPTWDQVARLVTEADGDTPLQLRNGAILRLLAIYGLRSSEVRRLQVEDIDWASHRIHIIRSKSGHREVLPLEPTVEHALSRYVRDARWNRDHVALFLTGCAPFRPLSAGPLSHRVFALADHRRATEGPRSPRLAPCVRPASDRRGAVLQRSG
jgi:integrase/recombinase XerD